MAGSSGAGHRACGRAGRILAGLAAAAQSFAPAGANDTVPAAIERELEEYAIPTRIDHAGRILVPVRVNGQGPFRFILDTGANRSVLSPNVAARLQLVPSTSTSIGVHGVTGSAVMPAVEIDSITAGDLEVVRKRRVPVLPGSVLANADGILGIEGLMSSRIEIDFANDIVRVVRSNGRPPENGMLAIPATLRNNGLLMVRGRVGRVRIKAIIDTGAEKSLGNLALRRALERVPKRPQEYVVTTVIGATPDLGEGALQLAPSVQLGDTEIRNLEITFGDLHVFRVWNLETEPALLIGMDLLGTVERLVIDYRRREIQVKP